MGTRVAIREGAPKEVKGSKFVIAAVRVKERGTQNNLVFTGASHSAIRIRPDFLPYYTSTDNEDGFIVANNGELYFVDRLLATSMAKQLNIKMTHSILSSDDLE